jgi:two-component system, sensor histidine kinase and response regulator
MISTQLFNKAQLIDNLDGDAEFAESLMGDALIELPLEVVKLQDVCQGDDSQAIHLHAHTIKGMAANLCASTLRDICLKIETAAKDDDLKSARAFLPELEQAMLMTIEAIKIT